MERDFNVVDIMNDIKENIQSSEMSVAAQYLASPYYVRWMAEFKKQEQLIIIGSGVYGLRLYDMLAAEGISDKVKCFGDNSKERQSQKERDLSILSVETAVAAYPDAYFIITPQKYENELLRQLIHLGISVDRICVYMFAHTGLVD